MTHTKPFNVRALSSQQRADLACTIATAFQRGETQRHIARGLGCSTYLVSTLLREAGMPRRPRKTAAGEVPRDHARNRIRAVIDYAHGADIAAIASRANVHLHTVYAWFNQLGISTAELQHIRDTPTMYHDQADQHPTVHKLLVAGFAITPTLAMHGADTGLHASRRHSGHLDVVVAWSDDYAIGTRVSQSRDWIKPFAPTGNRRLGPGSFADIAEQAIACGDVPQQVRAQQIDQIDKRRTRSAPTPSFVG